MLVAANVVYAIVALILPIISLTNAVTVQASTLALPYLVVACASLAVAGAIAVYGASMHAQATELVRSARDRGALNRLLYLLTAFVAIVVILFVARLVVISIAFTETIQQDYLVGPRRNDGSGDAGLVNPDLLLLSHCPGMSAGACTWIAIWLPELVPAAFVLVLMWRPEGDRALAVLGPELRRLADAREQDEASLQRGFGTFPSAGSHGSEGGQPHSQSQGGPHGPGGLARKGRESSAASATSLARSQVARLGL